ncbi:MAG: stage II sporulation protein D [Bacilli bacterium]
MKKIIIFTFFIIIIPYFILNLYSKNIKEIELKTDESIKVRVKRLQKDKIDEIELNEYVLGVLAGEMPISFELEALKAQAVASRSYVLKRLDYNKDKDYDVVDSVTNQVYLDNEHLKKAWGDNYIKNINKLKTAVNETFNEYLECDGQIADALFFSTSNGYTENSELVFNFAVSYLKSVSSPWDKEVTTAFKTTKEMSLQEFYERLNLPYQEKIKIENIDRSATNRILKIKINNQEFTGREIYNKLKIRSTDFTIEQENTNIIITTIGYGHGVGMSQYGALGMAKKGYNYKEILTHYYQNTQIKKI